MSGRDRRKSFLASSSGPRHRASPSYATCDATSVGSVGGGGAAGVMVNVTTFDVSTVTPSVPSAEAPIEPEVTVDGSLADTVATTCCAKGTAPAVTSVVAGANVIRGSGELQVIEGV